MFHRMPAGVSLLQPDVLLSTWFGSGLIAFASGTWGSLAALPFAWLIAYYISPLALIPASILIFLVGLWSSGSFAKKLGKKDPSPVVIDEVAGMWLTLALVPISPLAYLIGFLVFRVADIVKPWPANWADRELPGGIGIMLDDMISGLYCMVALWALFKWVL